MIIHRKSAKALKSNIVITSSSKLTMFGLKTSNGVCHQCAIFVVRMTFVLHLRVSTEEKVIRE